MDSEYPASNRKNMLCQNDVPGILDHFGLLDVVQIDEFVYNGVYGQPGGTVNVEFCRDVSPMCDYRMCREA